MSRDTYLTKISKIALESTKSRSHNKKVDTPKEFIDKAGADLWKLHPMDALVYESADLRKRLNWFARFTLSLIIIGIFLFLIYILFEGKVPKDSRDLVNILIGAFVAVIAKVTDYWFKEKEDSEVEEAKAVHHAERRHNKGS